MADSPDPDSPADVEAEPDPEPDLSETAAPAGLSLSSAAARPQVPSGLRRWLPSRTVAIRILLGTAAGVAVVALLGVGLLVWVYQRAHTSNVGELSFDNELQVPPLLEPTEGEDGRQVFDLTFESGQTEFLEGQQTETWGLNGSYLSPTLRAERGEQVEVNVSNGVDETTTLHWHGMQLPAAMDGGPHQMIEPGETWSPTWEVDQPAATLWFHPHLHGATGEHVYRGAAGMFIVEDPEAEESGLPEEYGVDDVPLIVQDRRFSDDGSFDFSAPLFSSVGVLGEDILVNGTHDPHFEATTSLVRFRVLNGSNARVYNLGFDDDRPYWQVATDSGLLEEPNETTRLLLSPGERAEIVVEVEPGEQTVLRSYEQAMGGGFWQDRFSGGDDTFDLLQIRAADELEDSGEVPTGLTEFVDVPRPDEATVTRRFDLTSVSTINHRAMDMGRVDEVVEAGSVEVWEITNDHGSVHSFHPHLVHFMVVDIDGEAPPPHLQGWKDTVWVPPDATVRIVARFGDYADPVTPYMFHCHILDHEDRGMMGQFLVVEPGANTDPENYTIDHDHDHDHGSGGGGGGHSHH